MAKRENQNIELLKADRSTANESANKNMFACLAKDGAVICYFPTQSAFNKYAARFRRSVQRIKTETKNG